MRSLTPAEHFSYAVTVVGLIGFLLAGKKIWWAWYINIVNQILWVGFAIVTGYHAFLIGTAFYLFAFSRNAYLWTREHFKEHKYDRTNYCTGSWDGAENWVHPRCNVPGVPHLPHEVNPDDRFDDFDINRNRTPVALMDPDMPYFEPPRLDSFVHPKTPKYETEPDTRPFCTGRPRHPDCEEPILAHKPHFVTPKKEKS